MAMQAFDGGEAGDVADLVEDGQAQVFADAGQGLQQRMGTTGDLPGLSLQLLFELEDLVVEVADTGQVIPASNVGVDALFALAIHDADVHLVSVQVDSAVELRGGSVVLHVWSINWCPEDAG
jgi:hypothetical protein